jgi:hypothetical protein
MFGGFGADGTKKVTPEPPLATQPQQPIQQQFNNNAEEQHDDEFDEVDDLAEQASIRRRRLLDFGSDD